MNCKRWVVGLFLGCLASALYADSPIFLTLTGEWQGVIEGESVYENHANEIECIAYTHRLAGEPDPDTGITSKVRNHFPLTILKRLDKSSLKLFKAWQTHEPLEAEFRFYRRTIDGLIEHFYTVRLHKAYIAGIGQMLPNILDSESTAYPPMERISFTYGEMEVLFPPTGTTAGDKWHANTSKIPLSDVNFDGIVNMQDFVILADDWMTRY